KQTWSSCEQALAAYRRGGLDGVGLILHHAEGEAGPVLVGVDLDKCRDVQTGAIEDWALQVVRALDSYTEVSPSGQGLRISPIGRLPREGRKKGRFECYQTGRYVTVTGQHVAGTPLTVEQRHDQLQRIHRGVFGEGAPSPSAAQSQAGLSALDAA